ncbi:hypothetical protein F2P56_028707, partial [Juglans regia]
MLIRRRAFRTALSKRRVIRKLKVELRARSAEIDGGLVVGPRGLLGCVEGAEPDTGRPPRVSDLRGPFAPRPLPDTPVVLLRPSLRHSHFRFLIILHLFLNLICRRGKVVATETTTDVADLTSVGIGGRRRVEDDRVRGVVGSGGRSGSSRRRAGDDVGEGGDHDRELLLGGKAERRLVTRRRFGEFGSLKAGLILHVCSWVRVCESGSRGRFWKVALLSVNVSNAESVW